MIVENYYNPKAGKLFAVTLVNIPGDMAKLIIDDIRDCNSLKQVCVRYSGDHRTGTADFSISKPMACYDEDNKLVYDTNYRHLATILCAAMEQSLGIHDKMLGPSCSLNSILTDQMFGFELFDSMSAKLRNIEDHPEMLGVTSETGNVARSDFLSTKFEKLLRYLVRDKFDSIEFTNFGYDANAGLLTAKFSTLDGLIDMLDIEQFLDTSGLFGRQDFINQFSFKKGIAL